MPHPAYPFDILSKPVTGPTLVLVYNIAVLALVYLVNAYAIKVESWDEFESPMRNFDPRAHATAFVNFGCVCFIGRLLFICCSVVGCIVQDPPNLSKPYILYALSWDVICFFLIAYAVWATDPQNTWTLWMAGISPAFVWIYIAIIRTVVEIPMEVRQWIAENAPPPPTRTKRN